MQLSLQLSFRHMVPSEEIEALVRQKAAKLDEFASHIMRCRVVVEPKGKHHLHGNLYHIALRDAFDSAGRLLEDYVRRKRLDVKTLEEAPHAKVSKLVSEEGYGFLKTLDSREIYFHKNSVLHEGFDRLANGTEVAFVEEEGKKGPQASTVRIVGKHGHL